MSCCSKSVLFRVRALPAAVKCSNYSHSYLPDRMIYKLIVARQPWLIQQSHSPVVISVYTQVDAKSYYKFQKR